MFLVVPKAPLTIDTQHVVKFFLEVLVHFELNYSTLHRDIGNVSLVILLEKFCWTYCPNSFLPLFHAVIHSCGICLPPSSSPSSSSSLIVYLCSAAASFC